MFSFMLSSGYFWGCCFKVCRYFLFFLFFLNLLQLVLAHLVHTVVLTGFAVFCMVFQGVYTFNNILFAGFCVFRDVCRRLFLWSIILHILHISHLSLIFLLFLCIFPFLFRDFLCRCVLWFQFFSVLLSGAFFCGHFFITYHYCHWFFTYCYCFWFLYFCVVCW